MAHKPEVLFKTILFGLDSFSFPGFIPVFRFGVTYRSVLLTLLVRGKPNIAI